ncbi:MAG: beta-ketoacyl-[acyl-carrier-protein] synthase II [Nitrospiraceae bacterium]|nr:MAG: beta-ketoacyl-[acyl-carrier-protein] synthase II [Nitrospiraceae bacterium]
MKKRRVVITGLGVVAPNGIGKDEFWNALINGKSGVDLIMSFDTSELSSKIAAQSIDFDPLNYMDKKLARKVDRFVHLGLAASRMALDDSSLNLEKENRDRIGIIVGSVFGGVLFHESQIIARCQGKLNRVDPLTVPKVTSNSVTSHIAMTYGITGLNLVVSNACASGANAIGQAFSFIQNNEADIIFAGGVEAPISPITFASFCNLQLLSRGNSSPQTACRPYDKERDGFVLGEGGSVLIVEELTHAIKRNAYVYAEIAGYATNCGSYHMILPEPGGIENGKVMKAAIDDAEMQPQDIDYISAYGNATQLYDKAETQSIKRVFNEAAYNIPVSSIKSMIGHAVGASGALEAVSCILALENNVIPPTINYSSPDPDCDLDYVPNKARKARLNSVLLNSCGVGNNNASLIFSRFIDKRSAN